MTNSIHAEHSSVVFKITQSQGVPKSFSCARREDSINRLTLFLCNKSTDSLGPVIQFSADEIYDALLVAGKLDPTTINRCTD